MPDIDLSDTIEFLKHLKRGFDKDLFQSKLEELAYVAETTGIDAGDFHTLFKLWLNLSIPITKWIALGTCLVPQDRAEVRSVDYAFRWLLANYEVHTNFSRMAFLLDWLTAAMDSESINMAALDSGYEIIYRLLELEVLTPHVLKLIYKLTKPNDVSRKRVLVLMDYAKKREAKKTMYRQIQVLLGLFKSYRPDCVPEDVPAVSVHTSFKKINPTLVSRFKKIQEQRNISANERGRLLWRNPLNEGKHRGDALVPNLEFSSLLGRATKWSQIDFSEPVSLVARALWSGVSRPARLRALLSNKAGLTLLAVSSERDQAFHHCDLHHILTNTFLDGSPHSPREKADFLVRVVALQRTLLQPLAAVTRFLAQFLPFWNEKDYFTEILGLVEWLSPEVPEQLMSVVECMSRVYLRASPMEQCAILRSLTTLYDNLVYSSTRPRQHFLPSHPAPRYSEVLPLVATAIADLCQKGLQAAPEDMRVLYSALRAAEGCARAAGRAGGGGGGGAVPRPLVLALPLLAPSAVAVDKVAALLLEYRKIFSQMKAANKTKEQAYIEQRKTLEDYTSDFLTFLYHEQALSGRTSGIFFGKLQPQVVKKLLDLFPNFNGNFSLRSSLAFAPYSYMSLEGIYASEATNKMCFETAVSHNFPNLSQFLTRALPELRG